MNDFLLQQAEQIGRALISQGLTNQQVLYPLFEEYKVYVHNAGQESFLSLLMHRGVLRPDQAQYLAQQFPPQGYTSSGGFTPPSHVPSSSQMPAQPPINQQGPPISSQFQSPVHAPAPSPSTSAGSSFSGLSSSNAGTGAKIGPYEILGELGKGGQGVVYKVRDDNYQLLALKLLNTGKASEQARKRFVREREAMAKLKHPGIVQLIDHGESDKGDWIAMELITGDVLSDVLKSGRLSLSRRLELVAETARAVHAAHVLGIVHRDIKPSNVLVSETGQAKVMDFGLAKQLDRETMLTQEGAILGTPYYMAPEQVNSETGKIDPRTDVYALGVLLFEAVTNQRPFTAATTQGLYHKIMSEPPPPISSVDTKAPASLTQVCLKAMHKNPDARYQSAEDLANDIERARKGQKVEAASFGFFDHLKYGDRKTILLKTVGLPALVIVVVLSTWFGLTAFQSYRNRNRRAKYLRNTLIGLTKTLKGEGQRKEKVAREVLEQVFQTSEDIRKFVVEQKGSREAVELQVLVDSPSLSQLVGKTLLKLARKELNKGAMRKALNQSAKSKEWLAERDPMRLQAKLIEAEAMFSLGDLPGSTKRIDEIRALDKVPTKAHELKAKVLEVFEDFEGAAKLYARVAEEVSSEQRPRILAEQARLLAYSGQINASEKIFADLLGTPKPSTEVLVSRAQALRRLKKVDQAAAILQTAIKLAPKRHEIRQERVSLLLSQDRLEEAFVELTDALESFPKDPALRISRARVGLMLGRAQSARNDLEQASPIIRNDADLVAMDLVRALILAVENDSKNALRRVEAVLKITPCNIEALKLRAALQIKVGEQGSALKALKEVASRDRWLRERMGFQALAKGQWKQAQLLAEKLLKSDPQDSQALLLRAQAILASNQKDKGDRALKALAESRDQSIRLGQGPLGRAHRLLAFRDISTRRRGRLLLRAYRLYHPEGPEALWRLSRHDRSLSNDVRDQLARDALRWNPHAVNAQLQLVRRLQSQNQQSNASERLALLKGLAVKRLYPKEQEHYQLLMIQALADSQNKPMANRQLAFAEKTLRRRLYGARKYICEAFKDSAGAKKVEVLEKRDQQRLRAIHREIGPLVRYREGYDTPREQLIKARKLLEEANLINRNNSTTLALWGRLYVADAEGFTNALYRGVLTMKNPLELVLTMRFASDMMRFLSSFGVEKGFEKGGREQNLTEAEVGFNKAVFFLLETFRVSDPIPNAKKVLQLSNRCLELHPEFPTAYLVRSYAYIYLNQEDRARSDWNLLEDNGYHRAVLCNRVFAEIAAKRYGEAVKRLKKALNAGIRPHYFTGHYALRKIQKKPEVKQLLGGS